jgi:hypothetical protein
MNKPNGLKAKIQILPIKIDDKDRAKILKEMIKLREKAQLEEIKLDEMKRSHKEQEKIVIEDINDLHESIENKFQMASKGLEDREIMCLQRKNFELDPPAREFLDPDSKEILHTERLRPDEFQLMADEWVIGKSPVSSNSSGDQTSDSEEDTSE